MSSQHTLVVGIGSPYGDDQVGWLVADRLASRVVRNRTEVRRAASPTDVLDWLQDVERLVICDACRGLRHVGEVRRWNWPTPDIPAIAWSGTHDLSLPGVLALAERLARLPRQVIVWAIEAAPSCAAETLSADVSAAIPELVNRIACELDDVAPSEETRCTSSR